MVSVAWEVITDVLSDRVLPLIIARASHSVLHPLDWGAWELVVLGVFTQVGLEFYRHGVPKAFGSWAHLPARGKPLDVLAPRDRQFIAFSQLAIIVMTFHYLQFMAYSENVLWRPEQATFANTLLPLPALFVVYDAFYAPFHRALHHRSVYAYVHKHHHRQVVPTRGNTDAINVHPFEFVMGEYNHVLAIFLVSRYMCTLHAAAGILFLVVGGTLATLNHTRLDFSAITIPGTGARTCRTLLPSRPSLPLRRLSPKLWRRLSRRSAPLDRRRARLWRACARHAPRDPKLQLRPVHHALGLGDGHLPPPPVRRGID